MRTLHDQLAKQMLRVMLERAGDVHLEQEVSPDVQRIDVRFVPDPRRAAERGPLGLLGDLGVPVLPARAVPQDARPS